MNADTMGVRETLRSWADQARANAGWLIAFGVLTVIAGIFAITAPLGSGIGIILFVGFALIVGGVARAMAAFRAGSFGQGALALIGGLLGVAAGLVMVVRPGLGLATVTLMLGSYLLIDGIAGAILAFRVRPGPGWGGLLLSGILSVLLAILLLAEWPISGLWAVGTLIGVNLLFSGFSTISIGVAARRLFKAASP